ncbi:hypothetical protein THAOC_25660 [Thalassiosira oceanica]|uniref:Helicase-associated domain-containing protein n=1 Tax=Thalassiosira oceanica TaxID=159749 RepID=K0S0Y9_THAOC|nr:hypothetical protein THAOC_25660 [Thalassiosira oceanica]|eukprot:EJK54691.1 hypothetical protein THAOC_25660 [Thalassiosira oceanica]
MSDLSTDDGGGGEHDSIGPMIPELIFYRQNNKDGFRPSIESNKRVYRYSEATLARWVNDVNKNHRIPGHYSEDQLALLKAADFPFLESHLESWEKGFQNLCMFKKEHGHVNPKKRDPVNGRWVGAQRQNYRLKQEGKHTPLTDERISKLVAIGFEWSVKKSPREAWRGNYERLLEYRASEGHANVPRTYKADRALANWVKNQRSAKKKSALTEEQVRLLNEVDFTWTF